MNELTYEEEQFILHWGEMSTRWGINRSMAQIHALLYLSDEPLTAEEITNCLTLARSNVSTSIRELQAWGVIRIVHKMGDRRDHFEAVQDVWELFLVILDQRKHREIDPTLEMLRRCLATHESSKGRNEHSIQRMQEMLDLLETLVSWYEQMKRLSPAAQRKFLKIGRKISKITGS